MMKTAPALGALLLIGLIGCDAERKDDTPPDPLEAFAAVYEAMNARATPRRYVQRSVGRYSDFALSNAGQPYERYRQLVLVYDIRNFDVKRTDSLKSPYEATVKIVTTLLESPDFDAYNSAAAAEPSKQWSARETPHTAKFFYQDGQWIPRKGESFPVVDEPTYYDRPSRIDGVTYKRIE